MAGRVSGAPLGCPCAGAHMEDAWTYAAAPAGETRFRALEGRPYRRTLRHCAACGHHTSDPGFDPADLYAGGYMDDTYRDGGIAAAFAGVAGGFPANFIPAPPAPLLQGITQSFNFLRGIVMGCAEAHQPSSRLQFQSFGEGQRIEISVPDVYFPVSQQSRHLPRFPALHCKGNRRYALLQAGDVVNAIHPHPWNALQHR